MEDSTHPHLLMKQIKAFEKVIKKAAHSCLTGEFHLFTCMQNVEDSSCFSFDANQLNERSPFS